MDTIAEQFTQRQVEVLKASVCRLQSEIVPLASFTAAGVTAVVTLHLAYSPSLEVLMCWLKANWLAAAGYNPAMTHCPPADHGQSRYPGVQDLTNVLGRRKRIPALCRALAHSDIFSRL